MRIRLPVNRLPLLIGLVVGLLVAIVAWLVVTPLPRTTVPMPHWHGRFAMSPDARLVAFSHGAGEGRRWQGEIHVWDTQKGELVCAVPHAELYPPGTEGGYSMAFTPDLDKLVLFGCGEAKYHTLPAGTAWRPAVEHKFAFDWVQPRTSRLARDINGQLFVLCHDHTTKTATVHDLATGTAVSSWDQAGTLLELYPGGIIEQSGDGAAQFIEIPSGKRGQRLKPHIQVGGSLRMDYFAATPDGRSFVGIDGTVRLCTNNVEKRLPLPAHQFPVLSPEGRLLAVLVTSGHAYRDWRSDWLTRLGLRRNDHAVAVYDLEAQYELAYLPVRQPVQFSHDGKTLALIADDRLELYDVPFTRPWRWIIGLGLIASLLVLVCMVLLRAKKTAARPAAPIQ